MKDIFGYILSALGIAGIIIPIFDPETKSLPFLQNVPSTALLIASIVILAIGILILIKGNKKGRKVQIEREVPIYEGGQVIGFRKVKTI